MTGEDIAEGVTVESRIGACPVEYVGTADGKPYYFRARHRHWEFVVAETEELAVGACIHLEDRRQADFYACGVYGDGPHDASWMTTEQAEQIIASCVSAWRVARPKRLQEGGAVTV